MTARYNKEMAGLGEFGPQPMPQGWVAPPDMPAIATVAAASSAPFKPLRPGNPYDMPFTTVAPVYGTKD